jgi:hypothetical protein
MYRRKSIWLAIAATAALAGVNLDAQEVQALWTRDIGIPVTCENAGSSLYLEELTGNASWAGERIDPATGKTIGRVETVLPAGLDAKDVIKAKGLPRLERAGSPFSIVPGKDEMVLFDTGSLARISALPVSGSAKSEWHFLSDELLLRVDYGRCTLVSTADGSSRPLALPEQVKAAAVFPRGDHAYVAAGKNLVKIDGATGAVLWSSSEVRDLYLEESQRCLVGAVYEAKEGLVVETYRYAPGINMVDGVGIDTRFHLLDPATGKAVQPSFPTRLRFAVKGAKFIDRFNRFRSLGDGLYSVEGTNFSVIDLLGGKELWNFKRYSSNRFILRPNEKRIFPPTFSDQDSISVFEYDGEYTKYQLRTGKVVKRGKLGLDLSSVEAFGGQYLALGVNGNKAALAALDQASFASVQQFKVQEVAVSSLGQAGAVFVTKAGIQCYPRGAAPTTVPVPQEFGQAAVRCAGLSPDGRMVCLVSETLLAVVDLGTKATVQAIAWQPADLFGVGTKLVAGSVHWSGDSLFVSRESRVGQSRSLAEGSGGVAAFNLQSGTLAWSMTDVADDPLFFDDLGVVVCRAYGKPKLLAMAYPAK